MQHGVALKEHQSSMLGGDDHSRSKPWHQLEFSAAAFSPIRVEIAKDAVGEGCVVRTRSGGEVGEVKMYSGFARWGRSTCAPELALAGRAGVVKMHGEAASAALVKLNLDSDPSPIGPRVECEVGEGLGCR